MKTINKWFASAFLSSLCSVAVAGVCPGGSTVKGVDVSNYQGNIDWTQVKNSGVYFGFTLVTDGTGFVSPYFNTQWQGMKAAGIYRGAYQFYRPSQSASAQADLMLSKMGPLGSNDLPPVLDVEVTDGVSASAMVAGIKTWVTKVRNATGKTPIIYTGKYIWDGLGDTSSIGPVTLWIAAWDVTCPSIPNAWNTWKFHQYTDKGSVPGISGAVDLDKFNGTLQDLAALANGGSVTKPNPKNDLVAIAHSNTGSGATEVHVLSGESNYQTFIKHQATALHQTGADWQHLIADVDVDGKPDLVNIDHDGTGSGGVEMHTLSGASNYQAFIQHLTVPLAYSGTNATYAMAHLDGDGKLDLVSINHSATGSGSVEMHTLSAASNYQTFIQHLAIPLAYTGDNATYAMIDVNGDWFTDLVQILHDQTVSGATEVHVLSGASNYQTFIQHYATGLSTGGTNVAFEMADIDNDGKPDLVATDHNGTGSGMTEVHVLSGASNYKTFIRQQPTALGYTSSDSDTLVFGAF